MHRAKPFPSSTCPIISPLIKCTTRRGRKDGLRSVGFSVSIIEYIELHFPLRFRRWNVWNISRSPLNFRRSSN